MEELRKKAINYAEENFSEVMKEAFAKVYADGYRDGYKDCKEERTINLCDGNTEYVDLGLPSGTLWSSDFEKKDDSLLFLPYLEAEQLSIPTKEQWDELIGCCKWEHDFEMKETRCVGPNGIELRFTRTGMICAKKTVRGSNGKSIFWIQNDENSITMDADAAQIYYNDVPYHRTIVKAINKVFSGYKLPIRLVKAK